MCVLRGFVMVNFSPSLIVLDTLLYKTQLEATRKIQGKLLQKRIFTAASYDDHDSRSRGGSFFKYKFWF